MGAFDPAIWKRLECRPVAGQQLIGEVIDPTRSLDVLAAIDSSGRRHYLVRVSPDEPDFSDVDSRGVKVRTSDLVIEGHRGGRFIDVVCVEQSGHAVFDLIGRQITEGVASGGAPSNVVRQVLERCRHFWANLPKNVLGYEKQLGLFGELWFLSVWLLPLQGARFAVTNWRGPKGARNDFEWSNRAIEVKTTASADAKVHSISGLDQLSAPPGGSLHLFSLRVRQDGTSTNSLQGMVRKVRQAIDADLHAQVSFEETLQAAGYSDAHEGEYSRSTYRVCDEELYRVTSDFPKLTSESFSGDALRGILSIEYRIDLSGLWKLIVSRRPEGLADALQADGD
jgi:hypothetical protein